MPGAEADYTDLAMRSKASCEDVTMTAFPPGHSSKNFCSASDKARADGGLRPSLISTSQQYCCLLTGF